MPCGAGGTRRAAARPAAAPVRRQRPPAGAQDLDGLDVGPVVDHGLEQVGVAALGDPLEEVAPDHPAAFRDAGGCEHVVGAGHDVRLVEEHALHGRVACHRRPEQGSPTTADVDDGAEASEVVRVGDGVGHPARQCRHGVVEDRHLLGSRGEVAPQRLTVDRLEGTLTGADAVLQGTVGLPVERLAREDAPGRPASGKHPRKASPSPVFAYVSSSPPTTSPTAASTLINRAMAPACAPTAEARSATLRGPSESRSHSPRVAATCRAWDVWYPAMSRFSSPGASTPPR